MIFPRMSEFCNNPGFCPKFEPGDINRTWALTVRSFDDTAARDKMLATTKDERIRNILLPIVAWASSGIFFGLKAQSLDLLSQCPFILPDENSTMVASFMVDKDLSESCESNIKYKPL